MTPASVSVSASTPRWAVVAVAMTLPVTVTTMMHGAAREHRRGKRRGRDCRPNRKENPDTTHTHRLDAGCIGISTGPYAWAKV